MISRGPYQQLIVKTDNSDPTEILIKWRSSIQQGFTFEAESFDGQGLSFDYEPSEGYEMVIPVEEELANGQNCDETYHFYYDDQVYNHSVSLIMPEYGGTYTIFYNGNLCAEGELRDLDTKEKMNIFVLGDSGFEKCANPNFCSGNLSQNIGFLNEHLDDSSTGADLHVLLGDNAYGGSLVDYGDLDATQLSNLFPVQCDQSGTTIDESICADDFTDTDGMDHAWQQNFFNPLSGHLSSSPVLATIGNHEAEFSYHGEIDCESPAIVQRYNVEDYLMNFEAGEPEKAYYSHKIGDLLFISLNTELKSSFFDGSGTTYASRRADMIDWLDGQLSLDTKWKIVSTHTPIHSAGPRRGRNTYLPCWDDDEPDNEGWCSIEDRDMMDTIARKIDEYDVDLVMYGHNHFYERSLLVSGHYEFHNDDDITPSNGLPVVFSETDAMRLESDGCDGCFEDYQSAIASGTAFDYELFNEANFYKFEPEGTVFVLSGAASGIEQANSSSSPKQDFFNHPIMRPFDEPATSPSGYINGGRALNILSAGLIELEGDQLMYKQIGQDGILDQFTIHKCPTTEQTVSVCDGAQLISLNEFLDDDIPVESIQWTDCNGNSLSDPEIEASNFLGECQFRVEHAEGCQTINLTVELNESGPVITELPIVGPYCLIDETVIIQTINLGEFSNPQFEINGSSYTANSAGELTLPALSGAVDILFSTGSGDCDVEVEGSINVSISPVMADLSAPICLGGAMSFELQDEGTVSEFSGISSATVSGTTLTLPANLTAGSYEISWTAENGECSVAFDEDITLYPSSISIAVEPVVANNTCEANLIAQQGDGSQWPSELCSQLTWMYNGQTSSGCELMADNDGLYTVSFAGCAQAYAEQLVNDDIIDEANGLRQARLLEDMEYLNSDLAPVYSFDDPEDPTEPWAIKGMITVLEGQTLVIDNQTISFFGGFSGITVESGGRLEINNSNFSGLDICSTGTEWFGISVEGNRNTPHPINYLDNIDVHKEHGLVLVTGASTISDAQYAISAFDWGYEVVGNEDFGGIIHADGCSFVNNKTGVYVRGFKDISRSKILNCTFQNDISFNNGLGTTDPIKQISLRNLDGLVTVKECRFEGFANLNVTGIYAAGAAVYAGDPDFQGGITGPIPTANNHDNEFINLEMGIDIYGDYSMGEYSRISHNKFDNVHMGITLNSTIFADVEHNDFVNIPLTQEANKESWGVMVWASAAFNIVSNTFETSNSVVNKEATNGLVIKDGRLADGTVDAADHAGVRDNTFNGVFTAATKFQGTNLTLDMNCNYYNDPSFADWLLSDNPGSTDFALNAQGDCGNQDNPTDNYPLSNQWHTLPNGFDPENPSEYDRYHISFVGQGAANLELAWNSSADYHSEPKHLNDDISIGFISCPADDVSNCSSTFYFEGPYMSPESNNDCPHTSRDVREDLRLKDKYAAIEKLECIDKNWSNFVLASTSIRSTETIKAQQYLDQVNVVTARDQELKDYYTAKIATIDGNLGKTNTAIPLEEEREYWLEEHEQSNRKLLAEASSASQLGHSYRRHSASAKKQTNSLTAIPPQLVCYPNPNSGEFRLSLTENMPDQSLIVQVFDITGKLIWEDVNDFKGKSLTIQLKQVGIFIANVQLQDGTKLSTRVVVLP